MKRNIIIVLFICLVLLVGCSDNVIGNVSGAENEYITIDNVKYVKDYSDEYQNYSSNDKDKYLGNVTASDKVKMRVYSVKDDEEGNFIYALWGYEGCFYVRDTVIEKNIYINAIKDVYYNHILPDGTEFEDAEYMENYNMSENSFAICDVDLDGKNELLLAFTHDPMAAMRTIIYDYDKNTNKFKAQLTEFPASDFYDNGVIEILWSHNQGSAGDSLWPYTMFKYNKEIDRYEVIAQVDAWDKSFSENSYIAEVFPEEVDKDKDGIVYYIIQVGEDAANRTMDYKEYNEWRKSYLPSDTKEIEVSYINFTEENINSLMNK